MAIGVAHWTSDNKGQCLETNEGSSVTAPACYLSKCPGTVSGEKSRQNPEDCEVKRWSWESRGTKAAGVHRTEWGGGRTAQKEAPRDLGSCCGSPDVVSRSQCSSQQEQGLGVRKLTKAREEPGKGLKEALQMPILGQEQWLFPPASLENLIIHEALSWVLRALLPQEWGKTSSRLSPMPDLSSKS